MALDPDVLCEGDNVRACAHFWRCNFDILVRHIESFTVLCEDEETPSFVLN